MPSARIGDTYSCPECGGDRDALLTSMEANPRPATTAPRHGSPCNCTQNSRTSGAFSEMSTPALNAKWYDDERRGGNLKGS